jgi:hypothetical protein
MGVMDVTGDDPTPDSCRESDVFRFSSEGPIPKLSVPGGFAGLNGSNVLPLRVERWFFTSDFLMKPMNHSSCPVAYLEGARQERSTDS